MVRELVRIVCCHLPDFKCDSSALAQLRCTLEQPQRLRSQAKLLVGLITKKVQRTCTTTPAIRNAQALGNEKSRARFDLLRQLEDQIMDSNQKKAPWLQIGTTAHEEAMYDQ